jgi:hypothetical protein
MQGFLMAMLTELSKANKLISTIQQGSGLMQQK